MEWPEILIGASAIIAGLYYWSTLHFDFWKSRGVAAPSPKPFFGNLFDVAFGKLSFGEYLKMEYDANRDERMFGIFMRREPVLVLVDADLIKDVLIKDFSVFPYRGSRNFEEIEPLDQNLFNLAPDQWRLLRNKLSPAFTSGKLKQMFSHLLECGTKLEEHLGKFTSSNDVIECRELTARFTTDVIGTCAFGLEMNALDDENSEFRKMGRSIFEGGWKKSVKFRIREYTPWLYSMLGPLMTDHEKINFFLKIMRDTVDYRKANKIVKNDFIDLIMELRDNPRQVDELELTDILLTAQMFAFFVAGYETSSLSMSHGLYELAQHQASQDKLRAEINRELAKNDGKITYETIKSMKYLDMVFQEVLRMYPPVSSFVRKSTSAYTFAGTKVTVPKGTSVIIPVFAIHRDPRIYPKPEVFDPERFTDEAIAARHPMNWMAFSHGPKKCIAYRFANYQSKVGLVKILQHYRVEVCDKTQIPFIIDPENNLVLSSIHGIHLKVSKID